MSVRPHAGRHSIGKNLGLDEVTTLPPITRGQTSCDLSTGRESPETQAPGSEGVPLAHATAWRLLSKCEQRATLSTGALQGPQRRRSGDRFEHERVHGCTPLTPLQTAGGPLRGPGGTDFWGENEVVGCHFAQLTRLL